MSQASRSLRDTVALVEDTAVAVALDHLIVVPPPLAVDDEICGVPASAAIGLRHLLDAIQAQLDYVAAGSAEAQREAYWRCQSCASLLFEEMVEQRMQAIDASGASEASLWEDIRCYDAVGGRIGFEASVAAVAAERLLVGRRGLADYQRELGDRRSRSTAIRKAVASIWAGTGTFADHPVFCTHCKATIAESLQKAIEVCGAAVGPLGPWGPCPHCDQSTALLS
jgi:hypothetical protein